MVGEGCALRRSTAGATIQCTVRRHLVAGYNHRHNSFVADDYSPPVTDPGAASNVTMDAFDARERRLRALMLRAQAGDDAAYRALLVDLSRHVRTFYRRRLTGLPDEIEDLVQETLLAVHNQRHTYDSAQPLTAWAFAIARYKLVDLLRRRGRREARNDSLDDVSELFTGGDAEAGDAQRDLTSLLDALPERQRLAIVHVKIDGRSVAETAALTGMSESAVKVNIHRGLKTLAKNVRTAS